jgi:hypothetical protein
MIVFSAITPCKLIIFFSVLEEHATYLFRVPDWILHWQRKCLVYIGVLQWLWPIVITERTRRQILFLRKREWRVWYSLQAWKRLWRSKQHVRSNCGNKLVFLPGVTPEDYNLGGNYFPFHRDINFGINVQKFCMWITPLHVKATLQPPPLTFWHRNLTFKF